MKWIHIIAFLLLIIGGINWGLIGAFDFNLVNYLFAAWSMVERGIYILVGLSAIWIVATHKKECMICK